MDALKKSLLAIIALSLFLPTLQAEDKIYRVDGLPSDLHYSTGNTYEIHITASDYDAISEVNITVTNGSLSSSDVTYSKTATESSDYKLSGSNKKGRWVQLKLENIKEDIDSIGIIFRRKSTK